MGKNTRFWIKNIERGGFWKEGLIFNQHTKIISLTSRWGSCIFIVKEINLSYEAWKITFHIFFRSKIFKSECWWVLYNYIRNQHKRLIWLIGLLFCQHRQKRSQHEINFWAVYFFSFLVFFHRHWQGTGQ